MEGGRDGRKIDEPKTHDNFNPIFPFTGNIRGGRSDSP